LNWNSKTGLCWDCRQEGFLGIPARWRLYKGKRIRHHVWVFLTAYGDGPHQCWYCDTYIYDELLVHHKDGDQQNNELSNLAPMHRGCHTKHHHENGDIPAQTPPQWWLP
jgi:5-methylcytosine-specific restriction endonuclease McrA